MKTGLKWLGRIVGGLIAVVVVVIGIFYVRVESHRSRDIETPKVTLELPTDEASIAEGKHLLQIKACSECHGDDYGGKRFIDDPGVGKFSGANLTPASRTAKFSTEDWVRAIRFGVGPDHKPLIAMPADDFAKMSNSDLAKMIAYLKTLPTVQRESEPQRIGPVAVVLYNLGQLPLLFSHENVDMSAPVAEDVEKGATVEYGSYLAQGCTGCHGQGMSGGRIPGTPPEWPPARNLTPSGRLANWSLQDFAKVLREGKTPNGEQINPAYMPWPSMSNFTDVEIEALYKFIKQLPSRAEGTR